MCSYAVTLFKDIGVTTNPYIPAIATGMIRLVGTLVSTAPSQYQEANIIILPLITSPIDPDCWQY